MHKISILDRILLLATGLLAAYQISMGITGLNPLSTWGYTIGFGVLLVASLLLTILGFESLESPAVVVISTVIPLGIALGLVAEHLRQYTSFFLIFVVLGFGAVGFTRYLTQGKTATFVLAVTHGIAGLLITFIPVILSIQRKTAPGYLLVGLGGALIGVGGLLLAFLKAGKPLLNQETIYRLLPLILFLMVLSYVVGFSFA